MKRTGSNKIFFDNEIEKLKGVLYQFQMYHSGICCGCLLCDNFCVNGSDTWYQFEKHCIYKHYDFIKPYITDGRQIDIEFASKIEFLRIAPYNLRCVSKNIYKSSIAYYDNPQGTPILIANELDGAMFKIKDERVDTREQRAEITKAVDYGLSELNKGNSIHYMCIGGRSRSSVLACLVSSIVNSEFTFDDYFSKLRIDDNSVRKDSDILDLVKEMYNECA